MLHIEITKVWINNNYLKKKDCTSTNPVIFTRFGGVLSYAHTLGILCLIEIVYKIIKYKQRREAICTYSIDEEVKYIAFLP